MTLFSGVSLTCVGLRILDNQNLNRQVRTIAVIMIVKILKTIKVKVNKILNLTQPTTVTNLSTPTQVRRKISKSILMMIINQKSKANPTNSYHTHAVTPTLTVMDIISQLMMLLTHPSGPSKIETVAKTVRLVQFKTLKKVKRVS